MANLRERDIIEILKNFREKTNVLNSTIFSEDGLIIALDQAHLNEDEDQHISFGAICAGIIALAENGLETIKDDNDIKCISIQAGDHLDNEGFIIILQSITQIIKLSVIFPAFLNLGIINFELKQTVQKLSKYFLSVEQNITSEGVNTLI
ncbi:MAG: roadblock/LC7 domain-containing protein [Promethearchaeota archaeon]